MISNINQTTESRDYATSSSRLRNIHNLRSSASTYRAGKGGPKQAGHIFKITALMKPTTVLALYCVPCQCQEARKLDPRLCCAAAQTTDWLVLQVDAASSSPQERILRAHQWQSSKFQMKAEPQASPLAVAAVDKASSSSGYPRDRDPVLVDAG